MAKILIMDDEPGLRNVVFNMLKPTGHSLFLAEDGAQAIDIAKIEKPDLALLDMRVPDYDGLEVLAELKKMDPNVRCIMLSGYGDVESAVGAMKQGAFDYISKPFKIEEVLRVVNKALSVQPPAAPSPLHSPSPGSPGLSSVTRGEGTVTIEVPKTYIPTKPKTKVGIYVGLGILTAGLIGFLIWKFIAGRPAKYDSFAIPYSNASAIAWDGQHLWLADWTSGSVYKHKQNSTLSILSTINLGGIHPTGLVWDGDRLWSCSTMEKTIIKHRMDTTLSSEVIFPNPLQEPTALAWDGVHLWCADSAGGKIYKLMPVASGLNIAGVYDGTAGNPAGMFVWQNHLWVADGETGKIFEHDPNTLSVIGVYTLEPYASRIERLSGMAFDGKFIWTCTQKSSKIYRHAVPCLKKISF